MTVVQVKEWIFNPQVDAFLLKKWTKLIWKRHWENYLLFGKKGFMGNIKNDHSELSNCWIISPNGYFSFSVHKK